jgi:hypothetical protein
MEIEGEDDGVHRRRPAYRSHRANRWPSAMLSTRGLSRLHHRVGGNDEARQVDRENASPSGQIARMESTMIRLRVPCFLPDRRRFGNVSRLLGASYSTRARRSARSGACEEVVGDPFEIRGPPSQSGNVDTGCHLLAS